MVVINHNGVGFVTRYAHLSSFSVREGERVVKGQVIGLVGSTGRSTGSHLHYEVLVNGQLTDPMPLLTGSRRP
jgi:murein DD-endopeptidase MepM/ murein hydrolase activator NlpD